MPQVMNSSSATNFVLRQTLQQSQVLLSEGDQICTEWFFLSCINRTVPAGVIIQARQTSTCNVRLKQLFIIQKKKFCLYDDTFIKCLLFIHNSVSSRPGLFSLESDLIYHFVGLESIRIFAYILLCVYFYGLSLFLSIR